MEGSILYPLNQLKHVLPAAYVAEVEKYRGRETVLAKQIPPLSCLWNDVLHLTAVHPDVLKSALSASGKDFDLHFYEIDVTTLDRRRLIVYLYRTPSFGDEPIPLDEWEQFDVARLPPYASIPQQTLEYYRETISQGRDPLLFPLVPHIFYRGAIDISNARVIS